MAWIGRLGLVFALAAMVVASCGSSQPVSRTQLTIVALNESVGRAVLHLNCLPASGDVPAAGKACAALEREPQLITNPKRFVCAGGTFSWWDVVISGTLNGRAIRRSFSTCWTPQMATIGRLGLSWDVLKEHLVARRQESVSPGMNQTFQVGVLRSADLVTCNILGHRLEAGVPDTRGPNNKLSVGFGGTNVASVTLSVTHNGDGSVTASFHTGSS